MNLMKKQTFLQENILKKLIKVIYFLALTITVISFNNYVKAKEKWVIDKDISKIKFEIPVLFATNVIGEFKNFDGFVEIDLINNENNKAILSVDIGSIELNYNKYKNLILSPIFFDLSNYPISVLDTKKFSYTNEQELSLDIELTIKGISRMAITELKINRLTTNIVQILGKLEFNRNDFNIGTGNWKNTTILKNKIKIETNIFLLRE